ncbi:hypothetical protein DES49_1311 [Halospina denitrificans]|uniref:Divergent polysaccharide deacetylase n=1 Tax=Halospina denitrificans TaxID=332522 RepID=A0A4R7K0U3_9GAMM|nr:hypothetical protein DES49_1311 [Halospina denitrificans]
MLKTIGLTTLAWVLLLLCGSAQAMEKQPPTIAIIIDDLGVDREAAQRLIDLESPVTLAFLPYRPHTRELANAASRHGKEVMLHAPMANMGQVALGPGGLSLEMSREQIVQSLSESLKAVPHASGVNNHMGSLLTGQERPMRWVMDEIARHNLYFIDSRTTKATVAATTAHARDIPTMSRDVFLDNELSERSIHQQFRRLLKEARENGTAIGIGHPHEETIAYLEKILPKLDEYGYAVATVSGLWAIRQDRQPIPGRTLVPLEASSR